MDRPEDCPGWFDHESRSEIVEYNHDQYDSNLVKGMRANVQIVTSNFEEEKAFMVAEVLETSR